MVYFMCSARMLQSGKSVSSKRDSVMHINRTRKKYFIAQVTLEQLTLSLMRYASLFTNPSSPSSTVVDAGVEMTDSTQDSSVETPARGVINQDSSGGRPFQNNGHKDTQDDLSSERHENHTEHTPTSSTPETHHESTHNVPSCAGKPTLSVQPFQWFILCRCV